jgi:hypothetical protein
MCELKEHKKYKKIGDEIKAFFAGPEWEFTWICGRYADSDVDRYKKTRPRTTPGADAVSGYATIFLQVTNAKSGELYHFDYAIICPPPNGTCDLSDPESAEE